MGIYNNSPTFSWLSLTGIVVVKNDKTYIVSDFKTNLKYIYWDEENPNTLTATNEMKERKSTRFLVVTNNKGECIEVPNEGISVSFDGNSVEALSRHIWGLHETNDEFTNRFVSVEQDINGVKTTVGQTQESLGKAIEDISKVDQKADSIDLSVKKTQKEFNDNKELLELREHVNKSIIDLNSSVGIFKSKLNEYFRDNRISDDEKVEIGLHIEVLNERKSKVLAEIDKVYNLMESQGLDDKMAILLADKDKINADFDNLISLINSSISDNTIVPSEITVITNAFAKCNLTINVIKNDIDDMIFLGAGGSMLEQLANINIKSDEIELKVEEVNSNIDGVDKKYSEIILSPDGIINRVENVETTNTEQGKAIESTKSEIKQMAGSIDLAVSVANTANGNAVDAKSQVSILAGEITNKVSAGEVGSIIRQSPTDVKIGFNNISDSVVINSSGLTVNQGSIACDTLTTPYGHEPVINLFTSGQDNIDAKIDARSTTGEGMDRAIRFQYNRENYLFINRRGASFYKDGYVTYNFEPGKFSFDGTTMQSNGGTLIINKGLNVPFINENSHSHSEYASTNHTHSGYASSSHSHSQYYGWGYDAEFNSCMPTRHNGNQQYCGTVAQAWSYVCCYNLRYNNYGTNVNSASMSAMAQNTKRSNNIKNFFKNYTQLSQEVPDIPAKTMKSMAIDSSQPVEEYEYNDVFVLNERGESYVDGAKISAYQSQCLEILVNENSALSEKVGVLEKKLEELTNIVNQLVKQ